jgi:hypothetical protein
MFRYRRPAPSSSGAAQNANFIDRNESLRKKDLFKKLIKNERFTRRRGAKAPGAYFGLGQFELNQVGPFV